ncbi:MAG TPA: hypothetical protein VK206_09930 [Anaerolineales bacterium]|nr:hypothetical protein [Anaerolineales bacterium]
MIDLLWSYDFVDIEATPEATSVLASEGPARLAAQVYCNSVGLISSVI